MDYRRHPLPIRRTEIVASLSIAMDYGMGMPVEFAMNSCLLALRLGELLALGAADLRQVYFQALLSNIGCNADSQLASAIAGDEIRLRREFAEVDAGRPSDVVGLTIRLVRDHHRGASGWEIARAVVSSLLKLPQMKSHFAAHCQVAERIAQRLGFEDVISRNLTQTFERWDGKGLPRGTRGDAIAPAVQIVAACRDLLLFHRLEGAEAALAILKKRRGGAYSPEIVDRMLAEGTRIFDVLEEDSPLARVLERDPDRANRLTDDERDEAYRALADFVDIKSTFTVNHSRRVADLATVAAQSAGLAAEAPDLRSAGLLHELGRTGVPVLIWDKPGKLSDKERELVRLAPYYTERILAPAPELARIGTIATLHQERLDGSGYYRRLSAPLLPPGARILQAADVACAMTEDRAYRRAHSIEETAAELNRQVIAGKLDGDATKAVLAALGVRRPPDRGATVAGLTEREIEVLRLIAHGKTMKAIAADLTIAPKTVDRHIQNIYTKINVGTRSGATMFAIEKRLL